MGRHDGGQSRSAVAGLGPGGAAVATLNLATTEVFKDREGQKKEDTQWHRVILWGKTAETLQDYLTKGKQIYVEGKLQTRKWKDKDGVEREWRVNRTDALGFMGGAQNTNEECYLFSKMARLFGTAYIEHQARL
mgnify:CR=1 FL=1